MVVVAEPEADLVTGYFIRALDWNLLVAIRLVNNGFLETGGPIFRVQQKVSVRIEGRIGALDLPCDAAGVGAGRDNEVVLQLALVAIEDQVHAGIDLRVVYFAVCWNARAPFLRVVTDQIAHDAALRVDPHDGRVGIGAKQLHA